MHEEEWSIPVPKRKMDWCAGRGLLGALPFDFALLATFVEAQRDASSPGSRIVGQQDSGAVLFARFKVSLNRTREAMAYCNNL
jgi:hypothetical protein